MRHSKQSISVSSGRSNEGMKKSTDAKSERRRGPLQQENGSNPSSDVVAAASAVGDDAAVAAAVVGSDVADVVEVEWGCRGS